MQIFVITKCHSMRKCFMLYKNVLLLKTCTHRERRQVETSSFGGYRNLSSFWEKATCITFAFTLQMDKVHCNFNSKYFFFSSVMPSSPHQWNMPVCHPRVWTEPPVWKTQRASIASVATAGPDTPALMVIFSATHTRSWGAGQCEIGCYWIKASVWL